MRLRLRYKVKEIARQKGYSRGKLSRASDVDVTTLRRLFDDPRYNPSTETLFKVAKVLGTTLDDLVEEITNA